jgi:hypothetical protein
MMATKNRRPRDQKRGRAEDAALVSRIADALNPALELSLGGAATIQDPVDPPPEDTAWASICFELEERLVDVVIATPREPKPKASGSLLLLETGGPGATVYNFDLAARVRDAVKDVLGSTFDVIFTEAGDELYANSPEDRSAAAQFEFAIARRSVEIVIFVQPFPPDVTAEVLPFKRP